jgi:CRISPR-associated protein Cas2
MFLVVCYDVPARRTEIYRKLLGRYLIWMQNSVFSGDLTESTYKRMRHDIQEIMDDEDRLAFISTQNRHNIDVETVEKKASSSSDSHQGSTTL